MTIDTGAKGRVVLTDHPWPDVDLEREIFADAGFELVAGPEQAGSADEIEALIHKADPIAILTCWGQVSAAAISRPSALAVVARLGVGLDNIAVAVATARGAWVTNVPDYCVGEVSDHAIGLLLAHYRGICRLDAATKASGWAPDGANLERVADLTVAIIGYGRIGRETGRKLAAFGCRILAVSREDLPAEDPAEKVDVAAAQAQADVIILHAPLTPETAHMVDEAFLSSCKRRPLLINVSRGGLVDNDALVAALEDGRLRGAALDVVDNEPAPPADVTTRADIIVTPHVAFASTASMIELRRRACQEAVRVLQGQRPLHPCNQPASIASTTPLDGGVASDISIVNTPSGPIVVKQALAKLRVAADWFSDPARSATEVAAIDAFADLIGPENVPEIVWVAPEDNSFAMRLVDPRLRNWKKDLLSGTVDLQTAAAAGKLLGRVHKRSMAREDLRQRFADWTYFHELRIDPFFLRVAERLPDCGHAIRATINAMEQRRIALVHGDYSPKNILADGADIVVLDFEVAHWGDPHFDIAFCVSHLVLKSLRRDANTADLAVAAQTFLTSYQSEGPLVDGEHLAHVVGCLMLARLEGSSPVDYLADLDAMQAKQIALALLAEGLLPQILTSFRS